MSRLVSIPVMFKVETLTNLLDIAKVVYGKVRHGAGCTYDKPKKGEKHYGTCTCGLWALGEALKPFRGDDHA